MDSQVDLNEVLDFILFGHPIASTCMDLRWLVSTCVDFGWAQIWTQVFLPFGHLLQVPTQVLVLRTCIDLLRLATLFGQDLRIIEWLVSEKIKK